MVTTWKIKKNNNLTQAKVSKKGRKKDKLLCTAFSLKLIFLITKYIFKKLN